MTIAARLKALRMRKGESLQQVADAVGASKPHIWELEAGRSGNPSLDLLTRLAAHFGVKIAYLVGEAEGTSGEAMVFGREFKNATEEDKKLILQMAERLLGSGRMDEELRMELADHGSPEALAACIVSRFKGWRIPAPLEDIARAVGIQEIVLVETASYEGVLVTDALKTTGSIAIRADSREERRRFTIAHEIGHFLLPSHGANAECAKTDLATVRSKEPKNAKEAEANRFAVALLMPRAAFRADMRRLGVPETRHVLHLARRYGVSKEAAVRRYVELADDACAFVFSKDGRVGGLCRSEAFPYLTVRKGDLLPSAARSVLPVATADRISDWAEVDVSGWLEATPKLRGRTLWEQVLQQANGHRLTMLTLDEDEEDDEEGDGVWEPSFRR